MWFAIANWMKQFLSRSNGLWTWKCPQHTWIIIMDPVKFEAFVCTEFTMKVVLYHVAVVGILCSDLHKRPFCFTRIFCQTSSRWGQLNTTIYYWGKKIEEDFLLGLQKKKCRSLNKMYKKFDQDVLNYKMYKNLYQQYLFQSMWILVYAVHN